MLGKRHVHPDRLKLDCALSHLRGLHYFATSIEFRPTLRRSAWPDAKKKGQTGRQKLYSGLIDSVSANEKKKPQQP